MDTSAVLIRVMLPGLAGFAGSRSGALIATAWASMVHLGETGFLDITKRIMQARRAKPSSANRSSMLRGLCMLTAC